MRKTLGIVVLFFLCLQLHATIYYVSPTGNDSDPGTLAQPWATWGRAITGRYPGDTVYFRGGVYYETNSQSGSPSGTEAAPIYLYNYPGEVPILDGIYKTIRRSGFILDHASYINIKGLTVRNQPQIDESNSLAGFGFQWCNNITVENCIAYNIGVRGFYIFESDEMYFSNCDAYNCIDYLTDGEHGDGFLVWDTSEGSVYEAAHIYFDGCRAWNCSDDGWDAETEGYIEFKNCWSFYNGSFDLSRAAGNGFKSGLTELESDVLGKKITNCIAAYNKGSGFTTNDRNWPARWMQIFNNISYKNYWGIAIYNTSSSDEQELKRTFKNNISYDNSNSEVFVGGGALYTHEHNTWDIPLTLTDADFISVDSTGITAPRQADGSLPDNDCYKYFLRPSSTFIGYQQGTDVGLTYDAVDSLWLAPPSIGFKEYYPITPAVEPTLADVATYQPRWITTTTATTGGYIADDGGADITARGVCWNTTGAPTTADSKTSDGTGDGAFTSTMTDLTYGTVYYVRAYGTNSAGTSYGSEMTFRTSIIKHDNKVIKHNGKIMVID
jgi:parallel beta-helix repeat protein